MANIQKTVSGIAMVLMTLLYLLETLTGVSTGTAAAAAAAMVVVAHLPFMGKTFRIPAVMFFLLGAGILLVEGAPVSQWFTGLYSMLKTAVILIVMQGLSLAMHRGQFESAISVCLQGGAKSLAGLFCLVMLLAHLLASVMSLGAVVVILAAITPALEGRLAEGKQFIAASVSWGYCTLFLWAPGTVTVLMSMQIFDLSWQSYFPPAFALSLLGLVIGAVLALIRFRNQKESLNLSGPKPSREDWRKVKQLGAVLAVLVVGITGLEQMKFSSSTGRLLVVTMVVSGAWLLTQKRTPGEAPLFSTWWKDYLPRNRDLTTFFLSMGIFSGAIQYSGFSDVLTDFCQRYQAFWGPVVLPLLPLVIVLFSLVGLHPFVSVLMVGPVLAGMVLPASPLQLGLAMSLGCCLSYMLSPFAGLILALSSGLEKPPAQICICANLGYAAIYYAAATGMISLLPM